MPRVDAGWIAIDNSTIERMDGQGLQSLARLAVEERAVLVTKPSIVTVRVDYRSVRMTLGVGSLVFLPSSNVEGLILARPEWVDGCRVEGIVPPGRGEGDILENEGVLVAREFEDPVALAGNGRRGVFRYRECDGLGILFLGDDVVAAYQGEGYCIGLEGRVGELLAFIASLYTPCRGR